MNNNLLKTMEQIAEHQHLVNDISKMLLPLETGAAFPILCMILEEYCKAKNINVVAASALLSDAIQDINKNFGPY